jgi:hypothetical protein
VLLEPEEEAKMLDRAQREAEVALKQIKEVAAGPHHTIWTVAAVGEAAGAVG